MSLFNKCICRTESEYMVFYGLAVGRKRQWAVGSRQWGKQPKGKRQKAEGRGQRGKAKGRRQTANVQMCKCENGIQGRRQKPRHGKATSELKATFLVRIPIINFINPVNPINLLTGQLVNWSTGQLPPNYASYP
jgi:hypothetical protein